MCAKDTRQIYWHQELPPLNVEAGGEVLVEATSRRVPGTLAHRDEIWTQCYEDLMAQARVRIVQEVRRLRGSCAHVLDESVDSRHDGATGETWLHGSFTCVIYRPLKLASRQTSALPLAEATQRLAR